MKKTFSIVIALALALAFSLIVTAPVAADPGTTYYVSTTGSDVTGDGSWHSPWKTVQYAIGQVYSGDTIEVAPGTYVETGQIVISSNLTITGTDKETTIIKPAQDTGSSGDARGWFLVQAGTEFNLSNVTLDGQGKNVHQAIRSLGSGTIDNNIIKNIRYSQYYGLGVVVMGDYSMTISDNTFTGIERIGIMAYGSGVMDAQITGNTYTGKGEGDWLDYGVEIGGGATATITGNNISNCGPSTTAWESAGILATDLYGPGTEATITGNTLMNNAMGIAVGYDDTDLSVATISGNTFGDNTYQVDCTSSVDVDLEATLADNTFDRAVVVRGSGIKVPTIFSSIQDAIDAAVAGDTVEVSAGTYAENVIVNKQLTLQAAEAGVIVDAGGTPSSDPGVIGIKITASGATVDGMEVINARGHWSAGVAVSGSIRGVSIMNCTVHYANTGISLYETGDGAANSIIGNTVYDIYNDYSTAGCGIIAWGDSAPCNNTTVTDNEIYNTQRWSIGLGSDAIAPCVDNVISGNDIHDNNDTEAIGVGFINAVNNTITGNNISGCQFGMGLNKGTSNNDISGNIITDNEIGIGFYAASGLGSDGNTLENNTISSNTWQGVYIDNCDDNTFTGNTIGNNQHGIMLDHGSSGTSIAGNTLSDNVIGVSLYDASNGNTLEGNTVSSNTWAGVLMENSDDNEVSGNTLESNQNGIYLDSGADGNTIEGNTVSSSANINIFADSATDVSITGNTVSSSVGWAGIVFTNGATGEVHYNNIVGNAIAGLINDTAADIDATANWWGDATGPYHWVTNTGGAGNAVSDKVDYSPWWGANYVGVDHPWTWYTNDSVQEAVDDASAGDTVNVLAGTYDEQVTIDKSLTAIGAGKDQTFLKAAGSPVITVSADDVTIQDLEITDDPYLVEGIRVVSGASTGLTVDRVDFTELGAGTGANAYGIRVTTSFTDLSISDCDFIAVDHTEYYRTIGVFAPNSLQLGDFVVSDSTFQKIWTGIYLRSAIDGLDVTGSTFGPVQSSDFAACASGIYIGDGDDDNFDIENVVISDNAFTEYGRGVYVWNYANNGTVSNFEIYGNNFTNSVWSSGIRFIAGLGDDEEVSFDGINVHDNVFTQNSTVGAHVALMDFRAYCELAYCDIDVTDNEVTLSGGPYTDPWTGIAFTAWEGPFTNTLIDGNVLNGGSCGGTGTPPSTGILLRHKSSEYWPSGALEMDITNNDITAFDHGVGIYDDVALQYGGLPTGSDVDINYNKIYGNALYGVVNGNSELVDATYNWWGDATGPYHEPLNTRGEGDAVSDNVLFDPWYGDEGMTTLVSHSTYKFVYDVPDPVVATEETLIPVTFATDVLGQVGYDGIRFKFSASGPGDVIFKATDSTNTTYTFTNSGYWGPAAGFNLTADYSATTDWSLNFTEPGEYTITFSLIVAPDGEVIAGIEGSQEVTVRAVDIFDYYRRLHGSDDEVDTLDLLAAADDWIADEVPPGFDEPITTMQLLALADEWFAS